MNKKQKDRAPFEGRSLNRLKTSFSPLVVSECLVGFCHLVRVVALFDSVAAAVGCVHKLACETLSHGLFAAITGVLNKPAHCKCYAALLTNFDWHLVGCAADATALHFELRLDAVECLAEDLNRVFLVALFDDVERAVKNAFSGGLLALYATAELLFEENSERFQAD
jgi:hypothetical protein